MLVQNEHKLNAAIVLELGIVIVASQSIRNAQSNGPLAGRPATGGLRR